MNSTVPLDGTAQTKMLKNKIIFYSFSLFLYDFLSSLSFFITFFLLSFPFFFFLSPPLPSTSVTLSSFFFFFFILQNLHLFFFSFSCHSLRTSLPLFFFLHLDHCHWDRPSSWSSVSPMRSTSGDRMFLFICLFFFQLWIPCDYGWWWWWVWAIFFFWVVDFVWLWVVVELGQFHMIWVV